MPYKQLNPNRKWIVNNIDDYPLNGNIIDTIGVQTVQPSRYDVFRGDIMVGALIYAHTLQTDASAGGIGADSFVFTNADQASATSTGKYWVNASNGFAYKTADPATTKFAQDQLSNSPNPTNGDMVVFGQMSATGTDRLVVRTGTELTILGNGAWTTGWWTSTLGQPALQSNGTSQLAVFRNPFLLIVPDTNKVHTVDQNLNVMNSRLVLPYNYTIQWCKVTESRVYLGVSDSRLHGVGGVFEYDPVNETAFFYPFDVPFSGAGVGFIDQNQLLVIGPDGRLKNFNGRGFDNLSETPISKRINSSSSALNMHRNGVIVEKSRYKFLMGGGFTGVWGGIFEYNKLDGNFYHNTSIISFSGDAAQLLFNSFGALFSDNVFTLAGVSDHDSLAVGIYCSENIRSLSANTRSYITFPRLPSNDIRDTFKKLWMKYRLFSGSIVLKYRNRLLSTQVLPSAAGIGGAVWASTTVFGTVDNIASASGTNWEVLMIAGKNSGMSAAISSIAVSGAGYAVTLAEAIGPTGGSSSYIITNFSQFNTVTATDVESNDYPIPQTAEREWIQFKVEIRASNANATIEDLFVELAPKIKIQ